MSSLSIASWNVNSLRVRLEQVVDWLQATQVDVLGLQELKMTDEEFPTEAFAKLGYHSVFTGQKTYNGVALISKRPLENIVTNLPNFDDPQRRYIAATCKGVRIVNVYVPNGQELNSDKFQYKQTWFAHLKQAMRADMQHHPRTVLMGDFNITPVDIDVHDPDKWRGKIHCSATERLMLQSLMAEGLYDTYRQFNQQGDCFSWWDYRGGGYRANEGLRIDLILSSAAALSNAVDCRIDEAPRKLERPSDHTPVIARYEFD